MRYIAIKPPRSARRAYKMDALRDHQYYRTIKEEVKEEVVDYGFAEVDQVKTEVEDTEFVEVDSHDVHQLCTACLCATRTTHMLDDDTLKKYYMNILTESQQELGIPVLQSPRLCCECVINLKRSVRFREQVLDSYRLLQPMLLTCDKEDLAEFLQTSVCRPGRLRTCFAHSVNISPQDEETQLMTAAVDDDDEAAKQYLLVIEARPSTLLETVTATDEETSQLFCDKNIVVCFSKDFDKQLEETDAHASKEVANCVTTINTSNSTDIEHTHVKGTFVCDYCHKMFTSKTALERHITTYDIYPHNNKAVTFPCKDSVVVLCSDNQCSECPNGHRLLQHIDMKMNVFEKHYQRKLYQTQRYADKKSLLIYNRRQNTGEKPFQCDVCLKPFLRKHHLILHTRTHTGEKPFQCQVCFKSFAAQSSLNEHLRKHTGEKPYKCEVCSKSFALVGSLTRHRRIHTGGKPYQCWLCHKSFTRKTHLIFHTNSAHTAKRLHYLAREFAKAYGYSFCWISNGQIYLRKAVGLPFVHVDNEAVLNNLKKNSTPMN